MKLRVGNYPFLQHFPTLVTYAYATGWGVQKLNYNTPILMYLQVNIVKPVVDVVNILVYVNMTKNVIKMVMTALIISAEKFRGF